MEIGEVAFTLASGLQQIVVDSNNNYYSSADGVLYNKDITKLISCPGGKETIDIPNSVNTLENYALSHSNLTSVNLPEGVTVIPTGLFEGCQRLTEVSIPEGVTTIEIYAFNKCTALTSLTLPSTLTTLADDWNLRCNSLMEYKVDGRNPYFTAVDGYLCSSNKKILIAAPMYGNAYIPETIEVIGINAFFNNFNLSYVKIPESVYAIDQYAFFNCEKLEEIEFPASVKMIWSKAFGKGDENIGLKNIKSYNPVPPEITASTFDYEATQAATLHVPEGCKDAYASAENWKNFVNITDDLPLAGIEDVRIESESDDNAPAYDLHGRRVTAPGHGLYISGGKLVRM